MKKLLCICCFLSLALTSLAQTPVSVTATVDYTLRYNLTQSRYEVYVRPTFVTSPASSTVNFNWGSSQVSVVTPASLANAPFSLSSVAAGGWSDNSQAFDVLGSDFHGVGSNGQKVMLTTGQETLLFMFTLPGGACVPGIRLFINGSDPDSSTAGMLGGDFANAMYDAMGATNLYMQNYANTGTTCTACNLTAPTLSK